MPASWYTAGNADFEPAQLPAAMVRIAHAVHKGRLYILTPIADETLVYSVWSYGLGDNTWRSETAVTSNSSYLGGPGVSVGDWIYFFQWSGFNTFRYNPTTGVTQDRANRSLASRSQLVAIGDYVYGELTTRYPTRYNTVTNVKDILPGTSPYSSDKDGSSAIVWDGKIIAGGNGANLYEYDPTAETWTFRGGTPDTRDTGLFLPVGDKIWLVGGNASDSSTQEVLILDPATWEWSSIPAPFYTYWAAAGVLDGRVIYAGGATPPYSFPQASIDQVWMYGLPPNQLDVTGSVLNWYPTEALLSVIADVTGGPGVHADLLVRGVTGRTITADLPALGSVPPTSVTRSNTDHSTAGDASTIITPDMEWGDDKVRSGEAYRDYSLSHAVGGELTGAITNIGRSAPAPPAHVPSPPLVTDAAYEWSRGADVITTSTAATPTLDALNDTTIETELMPPGISDITPTVIPKCLLGIDVDLCDVELSGVPCDEADALLDAVLPTRLELARRAADLASVTLLIHDGPGLVGHSDLVPADTVTVGRSVGEVIRDMLLRGDPRAWYAPGVMIIDGRALPSGSTAAPASDMLISDALWKDAAVNAARVDVIESPAPASAGDEPQLADFTADCSETLDPCDARTFETLQNGTLTWTENAGSGTSYVETEYKIVKENGHVVNETSILRGWRYYVKGPVGIGAFPTTFEQRFEPFQWTVRQHTYLACCPDALAHTIETVTAARYADRDADYDGAPDLWDTFPNSYLQSQKEVTQRWHAEGWLRSRIEVTSTIRGWKYDGTGISPTYDQSVRSERYVPVGGGLWSVETKLSEAANLPIASGATGEVSEGIGGTSTAVVNSYNVITDAAPPTVSCGGANPCGEVETCSERAQRLYDEAHAEWATADAIADAAASNMPARILRQVLTTTQRLPVALGDTVTTSRGDARIVRIDWSGGTPQSGQPGDELTIEAWSVLT